MFRHIFYSLLFVILICPFFLFCEKNSTKPFNREPEPVSINGTWKCHFMSNKIELFSIDVIVDQKQEDVIFYHKKDAIKLSTFKITDRSFITIIDPQNSTDVIPAKVQINGTVGDASQTIDGTWLTTEFGTGTLEMEKISDDKLPGFSIGESLLVPMGRSFIKNSEIEISMNNIIVDCSIKYDDFGGYWAFIPSTELSDTTSLKVKYTRRKDESYEYINKNDELDQWINATLFIDTDNDLIQNQAIQIYDEDKSLIENVQAIWTFTISYLQLDPEAKFNPSPASLKASDTYIQKVGCCINFSRLFVALCRASGIPARTISGIVQAYDNPDQYDFHHEWAEYMDENGVWHPLDLTYVKTLSLSDTRYTDLVYAAEDHVYFKDLTNENIESGQPVQLEDGNLVLYHYHPIFRGARYGFSLMEKNGTHEYIIEKTIILIKIDDRIVIRQSL